MAVRKRLVRLLEGYDRRMYDGFSNTEESPSKPVLLVEELQGWREKFPRRLPGEGSLLYFLLGSIVALLLALLAVRAVTGMNVASALKKPTAKHIEVERDESGRLRGITTFYEYD